MSDGSKEEGEKARLKSHLAITPKTVNMLHAAGYTTPESLATCTPSEITAGIIKLPGMGAKTAYPYTRAFRRMVVLGTMEAEQAAVVVEKYKTWSNAGLEKLGIYEEGFNDLTGVQIRAKMDGAGLTKPESNA